jgi:hypothetical protein
MLRPSLCFVVASMAVTILHEFTHAWTARSLGVGSTLYGYFADLDLTAAQAASNLPVLIRVSGPLVCLVQGMLCWFAYRRTQSARARLMLLYLSVFGVGTFCGNLMSAAFVGDFSAAAVALGIPVDSRYVIAALGAVSLVAVQVLAGREIVRGAPLAMSRLAAAFGLVALPALLGTAVVILVNQPMPTAFLGARLGECVFWLPAVVSGWFQVSRSPEPGRFDLGWTDAAAVGLLFLVVRLMVTGIRFSP